MKQAQEFLIKRQQVRVTIVLKGRQKGHPERAVTFLNDLYAAYLQDYGKLAKEASIGNLGLTLNPSSK